MQKHRHHFATISCITLAAALALPACSDDQAPDNSAVETSDSVVTPAELGMGDDWIKLEAGLWTRADDEGEQQFIGIGEPGRAYAIASLEEVVADLETMLAAADSEDTRQQIAEFDAYITELRVSEVPSVPEVAPRCPPSLSVIIDAYPSYCGVSAKASASYSHCSNWGTVRTIAQASCGYESKSSTCGPKNGSPVSCSSTVSITGPTPCKSYASAQINANGVYVFQVDENYLRGSCSDSGGTSVGSGLSCGPCSSGKDCHCGDTCQPVGSICP